MEKGDPMRKMRLVERRQLIDSIMHTENDNEAFLKKLRNRINMAGIELPTVEIKFQNVTVEAKCHVGSRALPTLLNATRNIAESILGLVGIRIANLTKVSILRDISGIIRPSRMTLLLGPPSSGKTTLLLHLAGKLDQALEIRGEVTYNGYKTCEFERQKTAAYISQNDLHTGEMTVEETLKFSTKCQGMGDRYELVSELIKREKAQGIVPDPEVDLFMKATSIEGVQSSLQTDYTMRILGLDTCAHTIIGDQMRKGISGGQKKRVTIGEMIVGPTKTFFMDEISTGLDSSTTHQVVKCLQQIVHLEEGTILMSLLQPAPEIFGLFDDIILLAEGQIIYQGPCEDVLNFFDSCGFRCPERKGTADFLQEVTSKKDQEQYWADGNKPYQFMPASEFVEHFKKFHVGRDLQSSLSIPIYKRKSNRAALVVTKPSVPLKQLLKASFAREWLLTKRNYSFYISRGIQLVITALITSTVFMRTDMQTRTEEDGAIYIGAIAYSLTVSIIYSFAEQYLAIMRQPVFYKQRDLLFYPTWVFTIPNCIIKMPISLLESTLWVLITYYIIGFAPEATRFFKQLLLIFLVREMGTGLFKVVAGLTRSMSISNTCGSIFFVIVVALGGFIVPKELIPKCWMWGYWLSPVKHSFTALAVNEMLSPRWMDRLALDGRRLGVAVLENINILTDESLYWKSAAVLLGYVVLFNILFTISLKYLNPLAKTNPVILEETLVEMKDKRSLSLDKDKKIDMKVQSWTESISNDSPKWCSCITYKKEAKEAASTRIMSLPFIPLAMSFKEVNYYIDMPPAKKGQGDTKHQLQLLSSVTGTFRPGILTALMGESGAGKTTLLDVLAGRKTSGYVEGEIRIAGYPKKQTTFARISGYCEQFDIHSPHLTVNESLIFSALLRLSTDVNREEKFRFVNKVIELVELDSLKEALVGIPGVCGLSTEQRKRLTIAVELVANPSIIFMDEPTSGLDARAAAVIMRTVRNIVDTGRTVVCTIHQPSIDIFESFDELLLIKRGGQVIYSGPLGQNSQKLIEYFEAIPGVKKIQDRCNPATWMLEASSVTNEARLGIDFADIYKSSSLNECKVALVEELSKPLPGTCDLNFPTQYCQSSYDQFKICLWKYRSIYWKNPEYNLSRFAMTLAIALLVGSFYWKLGQRRESSTDIISVIGALYLAVLITGYGNRSTVQPLIAQERTVFYREKAAGMYSALPYALSQVIIEVPYVLFQALCFTFIVYSMLSFQWTTMKFMWFFIIIFLSFLYFTYYGMLTVALSPNLQVAAILSSSVYLLFHLFSGFFIPRPELPVWWVWYYWICPVAWTLYGLIVTQYGDITDMIKVPGQTDQQIRYFVFKHFGYKDDHEAIMITVLFCFVILFALVYALCIRSLKFQQR